MQNYKVDIDKDKSELVDIILALASKDRKEIDNTLKNYSKSTVLSAYQKYKSELSLTEEDENKFLELVRMKKLRTLSGVTPVAVLTKPYACPGTCVFCPTEENMPKSYLSSEPGAQRAVMNEFDPYLQTFNRLTAYKNIGHPTDKIELIVLGGSWSVYPEDYQKWFVRKCFDAMNDFGSKYNGEMIKVVKRGEENFTWEQLFKSHKLNESSKSRCVGMSLETRPDLINESEVLRMRRLGATKVQIGIQSLDDTILKLNKRGHTVEESVNACNLLRQSGFKIQAHWMCNLYGSTPNKDKRDFKRLFELIEPDELKIYPCALVESAELMHYYKKNLWKPYSEDELSEVVEYALCHVPRYCRVSRVVRDFPSTDIVVGNKKTNFRQIVQRSIRNKGIRLQDIRAREIGGKKVGLKDLFLKSTRYETQVSTEVFLEYVTHQDDLAGFLRLSLPKIEVFIHELEGSAVIRELHIYGQSLEIGNEEEGKAQHIGLGKRLINQAVVVARENGFGNLSVISAIGTRDYYKKQGFVDGDLYQHHKIY